MHARLRWVVVVAGLVACGFPTASVGGADAEARIDADPSAPDAQPIDARPDAAIDGPPARCAIEPTGDALQGGSIGGTGGGGSVNLQCGVDQWPIGMAVEFSDQVTTGGGRSTYAIEVICASITWLGDQPIVGPSARLRAEGQGQTGWTPATLSADTMCAPGSAMVGLRGFIGDAGMLLANLAIRCAATSPAGVRTGDVVEIPIANTGTLDRVETEATCAAGLIDSVSARTGAGVDAIGFGCRATRCGE